jgi:hypothetical protein
MHALKRFGWLLPLFLTAGLPGSTAGCSDGSGPSCASEGEACGFFVASCCNGPCSTGKCSE